MTKKKDRKTSKNVSSLKRALKLFLLSKVKTSVAESQIVIRTRST